MNGLNQAANADEIVFHYERSLVSKDTIHAKNIRSAHSDLATRFDAVDERVARKA